MLNDKVDTFIKDLASGKFPDDAIEKMFLNLAVIYKVEKEEFWRAFDEIIVERPELAHSIKDNLSDKLDKVYSDKLQFQAGSKVGTDPNKIKRSL